MFETNAERMLQMVRPKIYHFYKVCKYRQREVDVEKVKICKSLE